jgi:diguanylate cyclase (GGDEF)-like protein
MPAEPSSPKLALRDHAVIAAGFDEQNSRTAEPETPVTIGTLWRGFGAPLEREYRRERTVYLATVSRVMVVISVVLYACYLAWDALTVRELLHPLVYALVFGIIAPSSLVSSFLVSRRVSIPWLRRRYVAILGLAGNSVSLIVLTTYGPALGIPWPYEWLAMNILYALFLVGLVVRISVPAAVTVVATVTATDIWMGAESTTLIHQTFFLSVFLSVAGVAAMLHERMDRDVWINKRRLHEQVMRDPLTGLYNHRYVFDHGTKLLRQAQRDGHSLATLLIDVDYFKRLNDTAGHQAGDQALRDIAAILESQAQRSFDVAGRIGGEEFVLLLYDCDKTSLAGLAEGLRARIEQHAIAHPGAPAGVLTVSIGATTTKHRTESFKQVLARADKALYQAKAEGRNCSRLL